MRRIYSILVPLCLIFILSLPAYAANNISSIDIKAYINDDGSMNITQIWQTDFNENTESYITMNAPDFLTIEDLTVSDKNGIYTTMEQWDIDGSLSKKAYKCGVNYLSKGYEICFGISEYGTNTYTISYKLNNVISAYNDADGVNFRFVNDGMNTTPTDVNLEISLSNGTNITDENCDIWGFGFGGNVEFNGGIIKAYTTQSLTKNDHVTVLLALNRGILNPNRIIDDSFEGVKKQAIDGSDYDYIGQEEEQSLLDIMLSALLFLSPFALIMFFILRNNKKEKKAIATIFEETGYFRDIPNHGNINATYALGELYGVCEEGAVLGTAILKLINSGALLPQKEESIGFMGKTKEVISLKLYPLPNDADEYDEYLYTILEAAAGEDRILQEKELSKYMDKNYKLLVNYIQKCDDKGRKYLNEKKCLTSVVKPAKAKYLTPSGRIELGEIIGLKKYLEDFSLIAQRGVEEMPIWREYLYYAQMFGIADKVIAQMKDMYPQIAPQIETYGRNVYMANSYYHYLYREIRQSEAKAQAARSAGSGGRSSFSGGGGSFGGGSGGGTR